MRGYELVFWFSLGGIIYAYFGYPLLLWMAGLVRQRRKLPEVSREPVLLSIIITVRNEEEVIAEKLKDTLALSFQGRSVAQGAAEVIVASDASDDGTDDVVRSYQEQGVRLVRLDARRGKEAAQGEAIKVATGNYLLFTDAKTWLEPDALDAAIGYLLQDKVGAVSSTDLLEGKSGGENLYVRYEMWIRRLESDVHSVVGLSGSCFAVRREVAQGLRTDIPSDFGLLIRAIQLGFNGVLGETMICRYRALQSDKAEFRRKVRTVLRGITTFFSCLEAANPMRYGMFSFQLISHKLCRWLVPWFGLTMIVSLIGLAQIGGFYLVTLVLVLAVLLLAVIGFVSENLRQRIWIKVPTFFVLTNLAVLVAWIYYLSGKRTVAWTPSKR